MSQIQSKKEEFKKYLQKTGAVDQLTKILVQLYQQPQKPDKSIEYLKKFLGATGDVDSERLMKDFEAAKQENQKIKKQIQEVKQEIDKRKKL